MNSEAKMEIKTQSELCKILLRRAKRIGIYDFNVDRIEMEQLSRGVKIRYFDNYRGKYHKTFVKGAATEEAVQKYGQAFLNNK